MVVFGDADQGTYYTSGGQNYDNYYQNGGNMQNANDYTLSVIQAQNGNMMDIEITAAYMGTGTKTVYIYAAVTEETSLKPTAAHPTPIHITSGRNGF